MRICSLLPSSTEILYSLGLGDEIVAVTHECDYPPEAAAKPHVTESIINPDRLSSLEIDHHVSSNVGRHGSIYQLKESLLHSLNPDLIVTQELCEVCAVSYSDVKRASRILDGAVRIVSLEPNTIGEVLETILMIGEITGRKEVATRRVAELGERLDRVREKVAGTSRRRVYAMEWLDPAYSGGHWVPEMVEIAGGREVLGRPGQKSERITPDQVIAAQPEIIVLMPCGFSLDRTIEEYRRTRMFEGWSGLPAVRNREVYAVNGSAYFNRSGPRLIDGVEILASIFHPDRAASHADAYERIMV
jgi:iron complex transport system substrate-binding protein